MIASLHSKTHIQQLLGRQRYMTGEQDWLLQDRTAMSFVGIGVPPAGQRLWSWMQMKMACFMKVGCVR